MPSLVATTSVLARKPCVSTHYVRTNILSSAARISLYINKIFFKLKSQGKPSKLKVYRLKLDKVLLNQIMFKQILNKQLFE